VVSFSKGLPYCQDTAFTLTRAGGAAAGVTVSWNADSSVATLTFIGDSASGGSPADGDYRPAIDGGRLRAASGIAVDADGDGGFNPGGVLAVDFARKFGDVDGNGVVDFLDFAKLRPILGNAAAYTAAFDFDGNGVIDFLDFAQFRPRVGT
jgi:dockerin type I repeat protein